MTIPHEQFYFIRHGETDWNRRRIYTGSKDIPLNQFGIRQAESAAHILKDEPIQHIVSSPLIRAHHTAEIIAEHIGSAITILDDLKECCWGVMEGQLVDDGTIFQRWANGSPHAGAEKVEDFDQRVMRGFQLALSIPGPILIVSHGGVYSTLQRTIFNGAVRVENCSPICHRPPEPPNASWFICGL